MKAGHQFTDVYLKLRDLSLYSGISVRRLRDFLRDPDHPLASFRVGGMILVRRSDFDCWMEENFRARGKSIDEMVDEVVSGLL